MRKPACPPHAAFTLIELLVVIAIIAVLASIAMPVYSRVMERSRSVQDANNQKQIGTAIISYLSDHDDDLFVTGSSGSGTTSWPKILAEGNYLNEWTIYQSPFDKRAKAAPDAPQNVSYGINTKAINTSVSKWASPSSTIMLAPTVASCTGGVATFQNYNADSNPTRSVPTPSNPAGTHMNCRQINALFGDGHIQPNMTWAQFSDTTSNSGRLWTPF